MKREEKEEEKRIMKRQEKREKKRGAMEMWQSPLFMIQSDIDTNSMIVYV